MGEQENGPGVGALLRTSRIRYGKDLCDMAQLLRIRIVYIEAIEDGRFQDLPGTTYAVGFIRAYAEHLGLDSEEVVKRFKAESQSIKGASKLRFPIPIDESSFPGGAVLFVGTVVAMLAYGGWYASTTMDDFFTDLIPPIPERLATLLREDGSTRQVYETGNKMDGSAETLSSPVTATAATPLWESPPSQPPDQVDEMQGSVSVDEETAASADISSGGASAPETDLDGPLTTPEGVDSLPESAEMAEAVPEVSLTEDEPVPGTEQSSGDEKQGAQNGAAPVIEIKNIAKPPKPEQLAAVPDSLQGKAGILRTDFVFGAENVGSRILVRAKSNSWIQVRDDVGNQLMLTRLLRPGDSYRVPDRPGLKLLTGNAGALEILVDGKAVPSIGSVGTVRHGISLDVERLREGTAVQD